MLHGQRAGHLRRMLTPQQKDHFRLRRRAQHRQRAPLGTHPDMFTLQRHARLQRGIPALVVIWLQQLLRRHPQRRIHLGQGNLHVPFCRAALHLRFGQPRPVLAIGADPRPIARRAVLHLQSDGERRAALGRREAEGVPGAGIDGGRILGVDLDQHRVRRKELAAVEIATVEVGIDHDQRRGTGRCRRDIGQPRQGGAGSEKPEQTGKQRRLTETARATRPAAGEDVSGNT